MEPLKYEMGLTTRKCHGVTATRHGRGWVGLRLSKYSLSLLCLASLSLCLASHFPFFFFFFCFLRFLLSPFGFGLLRVRVEFFILFYFFKIYMGHGLLGGPDDGLGFMIFGRGALAKNSRGAKLKTQGPKPFFLKILLAKIFFWAPGGGVAGPLCPLPGSVLL